MENVQKLENGQKFINYQIDKINHYASHRTAFVLNAVIQFLMLNLSSIGVLSFVPSYWFKIIMVGSNGLLALLAWRRIRVAKRALDTYTQVGLVLLIGMSTKNAILIVEFAKELHEAGESLVESAIRASILRLRAILMTVLSFLLGILPLVVATGAGAASRQSLGTAVFGGMIMSTILTLFLTPVFFVILEQLKVRFTKETK